MIYERDYQPQVRECDMDARIGAKGYLEYFQDMGSGFMHMLGLGNDEIPQKFGRFWIYTKYHLKIMSKADFMQPLHMKVWVSKSDKLRVWQDMEITRGEEVMAQGRLESCLYDLEKHLLCKLQDVNWDNELQQNLLPDVGNFNKHGKLLPEAEERNSSIVRYTDLDNGRHMNNLHYIPLFLDAFTPDFHESHRITDIEIHYIDQCYYGEKITVKLQQDENLYELFAVKESGSTAAYCRITAVNLQP